MNESINEDIPLRSCESGSCGSCEYCISKNSPHKNSIIVGIWKENE